jgi:hypothetical protein
MALVTYTGHTSGKLYIIPINYLRDGDVLTIISLREHTWWRNFRNRANITVYLCGRLLVAVSSSLVSPPSLYRHLQHIQK